MGQDHLHDETGQGRHFAASLRVLDMRVDFQVVKGLGHEESGASLDSAMASLPSYAR